MPQIFETIIEGTLTLEDYLICTAVAFLCGIIVTFAASYKSKLTKSFAMSLVMLAPIIETVILMVNGNIGTGIAVAGAFSLVRFRSVAGRAREITLIFLVMTAGLACAAGYVAIAILFSIILCVALIILARLPMRSERELELRITIPETLNFSEAFEDLFGQYTKRHELASVKTSNMGSLYKLLYKIELKDGGTSKEFIDQLRCRNGNLEITLADTSERNEEL